MRTFSRSDWNAAQEAWTEGGFSPEWRELRHVMALNGAIFPPSGDAWDSWEDDSPSQRAILIRAIRETPELLGRLSKGARSWSALIDRLTRARDTWRAENAERDADEEQRRAEERVSHREAVTSLAAILGRIEASR